MKPQIVAGILAVVVVVGGGIYYYSKGDTSVPAEAGQTATTTSSTSEQGKTFNGSIGQLAARGGDWTCTVASNTNGTASQGTVYVSGTKMRADFMVQGYEAHMISDGSYSYSWSSAYPQGVKTKVTQGTSAGPTSGQGVNTNTAYNYTCTPGMANATLFVPPTTVKFMSI